MAVKPIDLAITIFFIIAGFVALRAAVATDFTSLSS